MCLWIFQIGILWTDVEQGLSENIVRGKSQKVVGRLCVYKEQEEGRESRSFYQELFGADWILPQVREGIFGDSITGLGVRK